jgi:transposase InsO family protein
MGSLTYLVPPSPLMFGILVTEHLARFYFLIRYVPGKKNALADALTRREASSPGTALKDAARVQTLLKPEWLEQGVRPGSLGPELAAMDPQLHVVDRVLQANRGSPSLEEDRERARQGDSDWTLEGDLLLFKNRVVVPDEGDLRARLLDEIHRQISTAHPGKNKTKGLVRARYYWAAWTKDVERYVDNCLVCKRTNTRRDRPPGLLNPLPIPNRPWQHIAMDFRSFPTDKHGFDAAFVVVDRLSKRQVSIPCHKTTTAQKMAQLFIENVYRWKGPPDTIVSDRGGQFISDFWNELCDIIGAKLKLSTSRHPQTDGQTEIVNQYIAQRLRPFVNYYQDDWSEKLPMIDFAAGILPHDSVGVSPFLVDNGYEPRVSFDWRAASPPGNLKLERQQAQEFARHMEEIWDRAKLEMDRAQRAQKAQADRHRREVDFDVGDYVMVTTKDWNLGRPSRKLGEQAAGPYKIVGKVGHSYKLQLPDSIKVHPVFAPEKLRRAATTDPLQGQIPDPQPPIEVDGQEEWELERILAVRLVRQKLQYRAKWLGQDDDPTWYPAGNFKNSPYAIRDFHGQYPELPGPPKRLGQWVKAAEEDMFLEDHEDDDRPHGWKPRRRTNA